jgi:L-ascorbate metabolism protein UlaG (beta-lactamase superfamily)
MHIFRTTGAGFLLAAALCLPCAAQTTEITWHGHAAYTIKTPKGKVLLIDPWLKNPANPAAKNDADPFAGLGKVDYLLITHGHRDHVGDAVEIAKRTGAILVSNPELAGNMVKLSGYPSGKAESMGVGGELTVADGEVMIAMTPAVHSSSVFNDRAGPAEAERAYGGLAAGFVVRIEQGPTLYHSGDTAWFGDMAAIGEQYRIDAALLNIGGRFGMEPRMAAKAAKTLRARLAIPQHYASLPSLTASADGFARELKRLGVPFLEMKRGAAIRYQGARLLRPE